MKKKNEEITFNDILSVFLPKLWLIAIVAIVCAAAMGVMADRKVNTYTSTTVMDIRKVSDTINTSDIELANSVIIKISEYVKSDEFLLEVVSNIKLRCGEEAYPFLTSNFVRNSFSYVPLDNGLLRVSVTTTNKGLSAEIAKEFENLLPREFSDYSSYALKAVPINYAKKASQPNDKGVFKNAVVGFAAGSIISAVVIWLASVLDTRVRSQKKLEDNFDYPVLASVPGVIRSKNGKEDK